MDNYQDNDKLDFFSQIFGISSGLYHLYLGEDGEVRHNQYGLILYLNFTEDKFFDVKRKSIKC